MTLVSRFPQIVRAHVLADLQREHAARARLYPQRVEQGRMTQLESDEGTAVIAALLEDVDRLADWGVRPIPPSRHDSTWNVRRDALHRELGMRRRMYPRWIEAGRLSKADADHRTDCLLALIDAFDEGFDWRASNGSTLGSAVPPSEPQRQAITEWEAHWHRVEIWRAEPAQSQEEMFA